MRRTLSISDFKPRSQVPMAALPEVSRLASLLAESVSRSLSRLATASWRVTPDRIEETNVPQSQVFGVMIRFESDIGSLAPQLALDRPLISALMEAAMGGTGTEPPFEMGERPLSAVERATLNYISSDLADEFSKALSKHFGRDFGCSLQEQSDAPPLAVREKVSFHLLINVYGHSGEIRVSLPRDELEALIKSSSPVEDAVQNHSERQKLQENVGKSDIEFVVTLGPETLPVEDITGLRTGLMIALSSTVKSPVKLWSGGVAALEGSLVRSGDRMAVSITANLT